MDGRIALSPGTELRFDAASGPVRYTLGREIGRGGTCIVYDASYRDNLGNERLVRIKECCPLDARAQRQADGSLRAAPRDEARFHEAQARIRTAYQRSYELLRDEALCNALAATRDFYSANGTVYVTCAYTGGETFAQRVFGSLSECVQLTLSVARALDRIHRAGYLYLDLKPENILTLRGSNDLCQLMDFDSMIPIDAPRMDACLTFTPGYAPLEQQTGKADRLGPHSDVYSLGAVLFSALWHRPPDAFDCDSAAEFDYDGGFFADRTYQDGLYRALTEFFHRTLAGYIADRYPDMAGAMAQLERILALSDERAEWLISTPIRPQPPFYGREGEMARLGELLEKANGGVVSLHGMAGIGKSSLARACVLRGRGLWDAVLYLYDRGSADEMLADDMLVRVNTLKKAPDETVAAYAARKKTALRRLAAAGRILLVLDNVRADRLEALMPLMDIGMTTLLISRERLPEGLYPEMTLSRLPDEEMARLFERYAHCDLSDPRHHSAFSQIASAIEGHTLTMELIARQIGKSRITPDEAARMLVRLGFNGMPAEHVDYIRDGHVTHAPLIRILDTLIETESFSAGKKRLMRLLALFDPPGIDARLFLTLTGTATMDAVNELEAAGWLSGDQRMLSMHPLILEYVRAWPWADQALRDAEAMMERLYAMIRPSGDRHDGDKQFPEDYARLKELLRLAGQMVAHVGVRSEASQRLLARMLMDAPVDQDRGTLEGMLALLARADHLDPATVLRLYETSAYLYGRLEDYDGAFGQLRAMRSYLVRHPNAYYLSAYHKAMAVLLHNRDGGKALRTCLRHEDAAIAAARLSAHPDAKKQLCGALLDKVTSLLDAGRDMPACERMMAEVAALMARDIGENDYERYQGLCITAMYHAMRGETERATACIDEATHFALVTADSAMAYIDHLLDQAAPILLQMGEGDRAIAAVREAISLCDGREAYLQYRQKRFDALLLLGRVAEAAGQNDVALDAYDRAEGYRADSPWPLDPDEPLCPPGLRPPDTNKDPAKET